MEMTTEFTRDDKKYKYVFFMFSQTIEHKKVSQIYRTTSSDQQPVGD